MSKNIVLVESITAGEGNIITESTKDGKDVFLKGIVMQAEVQNRNGRIYPLNEMVNAVKQANESITQFGGIFGELDHPSGITINMDRISHVITEMYMDGTNVIGKCKLLNTPMGLIAKELANSGCRYGVSSRGVGKVNESTSHVEGFALTTIDLVATPSAPGAMPLPVYESLQEGKHKEVLTLAEAMRHDEAAQAFFKAEMRKWMQSLRTS